ncbi:Hypothetical protein NTJ_01552 [Nesidiocoris tenuis]|uniref:Secreted protein n=1 Tax=Nesidiocoris tenuis TaxID=355587 RepID=A0ABN7A964_9HEMI|nr:Hypothetical protein NTJ_01552 [Nesidiocoris tenuis]
MSVGCLFVARIQGSVNDREENSLCTVGWPVRCCWRSVLWLAVLFAGRLPRAPRSMSAKANVPSLPLFLLLRLLASACGFSPSETSLRNFSTVKLCFWYYLGT